MRFLFAGGNSAGHLAPSVAVLQALQRRDPHAEALFLCSQKEDDAAFLRAEQVSFVPLSTPRFSLLLPLQILQATAAAYRAIRQWKPDVLFSKGGAVSVVPCIVARLLGIPIVLHESDAVSGGANRLVSRWASVVCRGFPVSPSPSPVGGGTFTGNPLRSEITRGSREEGLRMTGFSGRRPILLVLGGSQGAVSINATVSRLLSSLLPLCDTVHITGRGKGTDVTETGYVARPVVYAEIAHLYAIATVALSRAGAGALSELAGNAIPAIIVPLRGVAHDHQLANARAAEATGGCICLAQEELEEDLIPILTELLEDPKRLKAMSQGIRALAVPNAAEKIANLLVRAGGR